MVLISPQQCLVAGLLRSHESSVFQGSSLGSEPDCARRCFSVVLRRHGRSAHPRLFLVVHVLSSHVARVSWEMLRSRLRSRRFSEGRQHEFDVDHVDYQELQFLPFHAKPPFAHDTVSVKEAMWLCLAFSVRLGYTAWQQYWRALLGLTHWSCVLLPVGRLISCLQMQVHASPSYLFINMPRTRWTCR